MDNNTKRVRRTSRPGSDSLGGDSGILNERVLVLVFESLKWDLHTLTAVAAVNRKLAAVAARLLWRELCLYRAPRMLATLTSGPAPSAAASPGGRIDGGWKALAKLMLFCCGYRGGGGTGFPSPSNSPGHVAKASRFSKTSGRSFLAKKCRGDLLYVSDPCEHPTAEAGEDLGVYRGIFRGFMRSKTRAFLVKRGVRLEEKVRCPYCGARVWSMTAARLVPRSAARRLGSRDGGLEYFVCINGHLHGMCWLIPLSSSDDDEDGAEEANSDGELDGDCRGKVENGSTSSAREKM
ncbi:unnamed protein product [Linum trigynum]|uniref:EID1-like F-box protein 3 n=1 Tax=Linum trigynum TaxID=586398 RepID=A0AAV2GDK1_9ROSI